jgi:hypothetical protein
MLKCLLFLIAVLQLALTQPIPLVSGQTATVTASGGTMTYYSISVAANQEIDISTAISGSWAYFYFRSAQLPTTSVYDQRSVIDAGNGRLKMGSCSITDNNRAGTMYIAFNPSSSVANAQFTVTIRDQLCLTPLSLNATLSPTWLSSGEYRYYYFDVTAENQNALRFNAQVLQGSATNNRIYYNVQLRPTTSLYYTYWSFDAARTIEISCLSIGRHFLAIFNDGNSFKQYGGTFENRLRPCALPITSGFTEVYDPLSNSQLYYVIDVLDNNFLNINVNEISADYVEIYVQKDRFPTTTDYISRYTGSTNSKFFSLNPCTVTAGKYYIGLWISTYGQMQIAVNTVSHKCITPMNSTYTETLTLHGEDWLYYTYDVSANRDQYVTFLAQQVSGTAYTYVQLDAQPTSSYAYMYNTNSGLKSLPLSPCDLQSSNMVYFAVRGLQDQTTVSLSLITSNVTCPVQLRSHVPYQALSFWGGDSYWTTSTTFWFEVTQSMTPMAMRMSITSQASQTMYLAFNRVPTTSDYDYYGSSVINVPISSFAVGTWRVLVRGYVRPFTITANFDSAATPVIVPSSIPAASPVSSPAINDACPLHTSCSSCTADGACGWCSYSGTCSRGSADGSDGYCPFSSWFYYSCPFEPIAETSCTASSCGQCFDKTGCVWCVTATSCVPRTSANSTCVNGHYTQVSQCTAAGSISSAIQISPINVVWFLVAFLFCL